MKPRTLALVAAVVMLLALAVVNANAATRGGGSAVRAGSVQYTNGNAIIQGGGTMARLSPRRTFASFTVALYAAPPRAKNGRLVSALVTKISPEDKRQTVGAVTRSACKPTKARWTWWMVVYGLSSTAKNRPAVTLYSKGAGKYLVCRP